MATLKLTIDGARSYADGRVRVIYRLTQNDQTTRIGSGVKVLKEDWDPLKCRINKTHPKSKELNLLLSTRLLELEKKLLLMTFTDDLTITELRDALLSNGENTKVLFTDFTKKEIKSLRDKGRFGNAQSYETALNRLIKFAGEDLCVDMISYTLLKDFDTQLIVEGLSRNTVAVYMREIRALMNIAIRKKIIEPNLYPFNSYKIKTEKTVSRAVTIKDLRKLQEAALEENTTMWHSRNIFFLIFNLIGISFIDLALLKKSSIQQGRIVYRRRKTGKIYSIKITAEAERIMNLYKDENNDYLISYLSIGETEKAEEREAIGLKLKTCNKYLKKLGKQMELPIPLTTYVARYSWANVAKSLGYPKDQIAEALGHEYGNRITGIYLDDYGNDVIDAVNKHVSSCVRMDAIHTPKTYDEVKA